MKWPRIAIWGRNRPQSFSWHDLQREHGKPQRGELLPSGAEIVYFEDGTSAVTFDNGLRAEARWYTSFPREET